MHGSLKIKFDNGQERIWKVARKRTLSINNQTFTFKIEADSTGNIESAGLYRNGNAFVTTIPSALLVQNCTASSWKLINGQIVYTVGSASLSAEFGYTSLTSKAGNCDATGSVLTYTDSTTIAKKYYPY
jgi:hypothetical protein